MLGHSPLQPTASNNSSVCIDLRVNRRWLNGIRRKIHHTAIEAEHCVEPLKGLVAAVAVAVAVPARYSGLQPFVVKSLGFATSRSL